MVRATFRSLGLALVLATVAGCRAAAPSSPVIHLDTTNASQATIVVKGLSAADLRALARLDLTGEEWASVLRVTVAAAARPDVSAMTGRYGVGDVVRFTPAFPLDPGRDYEVSFDPSRVPRTDLARLGATRAVVALPAVVHARSTVVSAVYPSGERIPANLLRIYLQFSAPMGQQGGLGHVVVLDAAGREITDALLPLDTELWSSDRTRYTLLFDPGRVKREILPNREMGRPLRAGETIALVVKADWLDAQGSALATEFRHAYRVGPPDEAPLDTAGWRVAAPDGGTRDGLVVTFPEPLDHALLQRALSVSGGSGPLTGQVSIEAGERRWTFVPAAPWAPGAHVLSVLPILEDLAGNRIGRAFEVRSPGDAAAPESTRPTSVPFIVRP